MFYPIQTVLALLCAGAVAWLTRNSPVMGPSVMAVVWAAVLSFGAYAWVSRTLYERAGKFVNAVLGATSVKLLCSLGFVAGMVFASPAVKAEGLAFVGSYFVSYFLLTAFEVFSIYRNLRPDLKKG